MNKAKTKEQIYEELCAPFNTIGVDGRIYPDLRWRPVGGDSFGAYIDARQAINRLNEVLGIDGWSNQLIETSASGLICELSLIIEGVQITKSNVGTKSNKDPEKGQASSAIKRAASVFGVGSYIYGIAPVKLTKKGQFFVTDKGDVLDTNEKWSSYINFKNPYKAKLSEVFYSFSEDKRKELNDSFKLIWNSLI